MTSQRLIGFSIVDISVMVALVTRSPSFVVSAVYQRETITNPARVNVYVVLSLETESLANAWWTTLVVYIPTAKFMIPYPCRYCFATQLAVFFGGWGHLTYTIWWSREPAVGSSQWKSILLDRETKGTLPNYLLKINVNMTLRGEGSGAWR